MDDLSGRVIRDYEIREWLGGGGYGAVYRAYQRSVGRDVALKVILPQYASQPEFIRRFEVEAQLVARLDHLHIVPLFEFWHDADGAFLVMRLMRGGSLRMRIHSGALAPVLTLRLLEQLAEALATSHQQGVIHRDIKPDNILFDKPGNAYLSDFGIAKDLSATGSTTPTGNQPVTPGYGAPEQFAGRVVTPRSDIYALGITLYECLVGKHPFPDIPLHHLANPLPSIQPYLPELAPNLDPVLRQATAKNPEERYGSAPALAQAFREAISRAGSVAVPPNTSAPPTVITPVHTPDTQQIANIYQTPVFDSVRHIPGAQSAVIIRTVDDVPALIRRFVGRESLLTQLHSLLNEQERVLLQGLGGMGKTTLAAETAAQRVRAGKTPIVWLRIGSESAGTVLEALMRPFNAHQMLASMPAELQAQTIRRVLNEQHVQLVVLDDAWNPKALKEVVDALPMQMPVLVTSRQRFPTFDIQEVGELERERALELLGYHARQPYDDADAEALCRLLGYHPFALKIAGEMLKVEKSTPAALLQRIADMPHLMTMPAGFEEPGRENVKALLDVSVNGLDSEARDAFLVFGALFVPEATAELIALCLTREPSAMQSHLNRLQERGLADCVPVGGIPHYRIHDLAYSYARATTWVSREEVIAACCGYVAQFKDDLNHLDAERANFLQAARRTERPDDLLAIIKTLAVDSEYFAARGHTQITLELLKLAIQTAKAKQEIETAHYLLSKLGNTYRDFFDDFDHALATYEEALDLARRLNNTNREAILLSLIGTVRFMQGASDSDEYHLRAENIARDHHDDSALCLILQSRGYQAMKRSDPDYESGRQLSHEAALIAARIARYEVQFFALLNRGACEQLLKQFDQALATHQEIYHLAEARSNRVWMAHALRDIGDDYHAIGNRGEAQKHLDESLLLWRESGATAEATDLIRYMQDRHYIVQPSPHDAG